MSHPRVRTVGFVALVVVLAAVAGLLGYVETRAARTSPTARTVSKPPAPLAGVTAAPASSAPGPTGTPARPTQVAAALRSALSARGLGGRVRASVVDVDSGRVLLDRGGAQPAAPASTAKLLTAAALLTVRSPTARITTTVARGTAGSIVLVGGGDPTLTAAPTAADAAYPHAARISDLAAQIRRSHVTVRRIVVDDALFTGPTVSPAWAAEDVPSSYGAAITAVLADGGRASPSATIRSATPDLAAGHELAAALGRPKLPVVRGAAPSGAPRLALVRSAPYSTLVEQMLMESDNVIAECLGRQVAIATGRPATFTGAAQAIRAVVRRLGVDPGAGMLDASGLAAADRLSATTLAAVVRVIAHASDPALRVIVAGLPVAAWSGTLGNRYLTGTAHSGAGVVRAKTGTLTGVSTLAGLVHDRSGRLLAIALMADRTTSTPVAESALDVAVADLARCGCD